MSTEYTNIHIRPPLQSWANELQMRSFDSERLSALRTSARQRLIASAEKFVLRIFEVAEDADLPRTRSRLLTGDPLTQPIVMTGHQPVVFHSGITFKYDTTQKFAADHDSIAVAVIIDTDRGDAGQFSFPQIPAGGAGTARAELAIESLSNSNNVYAHGKLKSADAIRQVCRTLQTSLTDLNFDDALTNSRDVFETIIETRSVTSSATEANIIGRWQHGVGNRMLELPFSAIASFPEVLTLTADVLKQPIRFAAAYNSSLDMFRDEHQIRNAANPFPNLRVGLESCELPFWVINHNTGERQVLEIQLEGSVTKLVAGETVIDTFAGNITADALEPMLLQNLQIVPRGGLITAFLRLLFADLFVHGTGGGRYDAFTDEFMRSWWNVEPSPFAVASASRYLFSHQRNEIQRLEAIDSALRDLQFNPQRHFGAGVFSEPLEAELRSLVDEKAEVVNRLKSARKAGASGKQLGQEIQQITTKIKDAVDAEFEPQLSLLRDLTPEQLDAINCRTYPWFFFLDREPVEPQ